MTTLLSTLRSPTHILSGGNKHALLPSWLLSLGWWKLLTAFVVVFHLAVPLHAVVHSRVLRCSCIPSSLPSFTQHRHQQLIVPLENGGTGVRRRFNRTWNARLEVWACSRSVRQKNKRKKKKTKTRCIQCDICSAFVGSKFRHEWCHSIVAGWHSVCCLD